MFRIKIVSGLAQPNKISFTKRQVNNSTLTNVHTFIYFCLSRIRKTQVNDSTKIYAILNLKLDNSRENCKGTGTHKKNSLAKWQVNNSTLKNVRHTIFFLVSRGFAKPKSTIQRRLTLYSI